MTAGPSHIPVLLEETLAALAPAPGETALDCTAGQGGHAEAIARAIGPTGTIVLCDHDPACLDAAEARVRSLPEPPAVVRFRGSFADAPRKMVEAGLAADVVLADLGFASSQMDDPARGLSFKSEGPLDMRLDPDAPTTAADLVNTLSEEELGEIVRDWGEERAWRRVARKIVEAREGSPIRSPSRLAHVVREAVGARGRSRIDPATRTFQALRIAVNDELGALAALLEAVRRSASGAGAATPWLRPGARLAVIAFHSLEDRPVKRAFADLVQRGLAERIVKGQVGPSEAETERNPRSRSARLRAIRLR